MSVPAEERRAFPNPMKGLRDYQEFHRWLDVEKGFGCELYMTLINLMEELGEVSEILKLINWRESVLISEAAADPRESALSEYRQGLGAELADCLAYLLKLANASDVDLEAAYLAKMERNMSRTWKAPAPKDDEPQLIGSR